MSGGHFIWTNQNAGFRLPQIVEMMFVFFFFSAILAAVAAAVAVDQPPSNAACHWLALGLARNVQNHVSEFLF